MKNEMTRLMNYCHLTEIDHLKLEKLLNQPKLREHLIQHPEFDKATLQEWINSKLEMDALPGCRVRAIEVNNQLVGWCGIQLEDGNYELAIILDESAWGLGKRIFKDMMQWAKEFGLEEVYIHLLHTRPENKYLTKMAKSVTHSELYGNTFTTYQLAVF